MLTTASERGRIRCSAGQTFRGVMVQVEKIDMLHPIKTGEMLVPANRLITMTNVLLCHAEKHAVIHPPRSRCFIFTLSKSALGQLVVVAWSPWSL